MHSLFTSRGNTVRTWLLKPWFSNLSVLPEEPVKTLRGPSPRVSNSEGLGQEGRICISSKFPGTGDAAGLQLPFENHCFKIPHERKKELQG